MSRLSLHSLSTKDSCKKSRMLKMIIFMGVRVSNLAWPCGAVQTTPYSTPDCRDDLLSYLKFISVFFLNL